MLMPPLRFEALLQVVTGLEEETLTGHVLLYICLDAWRNIEREMCCWQERDDLRKRTRQERLHYMKFGVRKSWVQLHRESMAMAC